MWTNLEKIFRDNKSTKVIQLDRELRNITLGNSNITNYCNKIKSLVDRLEHMDAKDPETNLVTYMLNGLSSKFRYVAINIQHRDLLPSFWDARSVLICEEQQMLQDDQREASFTHLDHPSSQNSLTIEAPNTNNNFCGGYREGRGGRNNQGGRGGGRYGGRHNFNSSNNGNFNGGHRQQQQPANGDSPSSRPWAYGWFLVHQPNQQVSLLPSPPVVFLPSPPSVSLHFQPNLTGLKQQSAQSGVAHQHQFFASQQPTSPFTNQQVFHAYIPAQQQNNKPTTLLKMFDTMTLNDPGQSEWYMDTSASSHLHSNAGILKTVFDNNSYSFVFVGDRTSIPVYPLRAKSDAFAKFVLFYALVKKQFQRTSKPSNVTTGVNIITKNFINYLIKMKKLNVDGTLSRYKSHLVANGRSQRPGIDCDETFSLVVKPSTIRIVLNIVITHQWPIRQLDVKTAFLHGHLHETVYMQQPLVFVIHTGLLMCDSSLFIYSQVSHKAYLLLYMDDIILTGTSTPLLAHITSLLSVEFAMKDLGDLHYFLGISATRSSIGLFLSQHKYATEIIDRASMLNCKAASTPVDLSAKFDGSGPPVVDPTLYRSLAGALQYLTFTRPDITYVVQQICLYMHDPRESHFTALKRILRYIKGTIDHGLQMFSSLDRDLIAYSDVDWAGCPVTRRSTSDYCVFLGHNLLSWSSKRQNTTSRSSAKAEYCGVANAVVETCWIHNLLLEFHYSPHKATIFYCDNVSAVYMFANLVPHQ
ncbi:uncharacterized protein LOC111920481 [Lactuca sativa]|uniref:uncharacterized protein LOC111920481 n=1 Tax=Lactuca sativa TaxID=4236 RepID=UPI000CD91C51|nr:uncharacterized protein LOC111920481 [Lactuca sativa]